MILRRLITSTAFLFLVIISNGEVLTFPPHIFMITRQLFDRIFPTKGLDPRKYNLVRERGRLIDALNSILPRYGIDTYLRLCAFFANCGIETDYFRTTTEYASGAAYEGRKDLGNTHRGDGKRFKGRGLSQTTGRFNYEQVQKAIGAALGIDVIQNPELLAEIEIAVESACIFWLDHDLNSYADRREFRKLSGIVNRGDERLIPIHWPKRNELYSLCRRLIPQDINLRSNEDVEPVQQLTPAVPLLSNKAGLADNVSNPADNLADKDTFLAAAFDKNVSPDQLKDVSKKAGRRAWQFLIRPLSLLYTALEAGNIAAWFGIVVLVAAVALTLYWHRADIVRLIGSVKAKFSQ